MASYKPVTGGGETFQTGASLGVPGGVPRSDAYWTTHDAHGPYPAPQNPQEAADKVAAFQRAGLPLSAIPPNELSMAGLNPRAPSITGTSSNGMLTDGGAGHTALGGIVGGVAGGVIGGGVGAALGAVGGTAISATNQFARAKDPSAQPGAAAAAAQPGVAPVTGTATPPLTADQLQQQLLDLQKGIRDQNLGFINGNVLPAINKANVAGDAAVAGKLQNLSDSRDQIQNYQGLNTQLAGFGWGNSQQANAADSQALTDYGTSLGGIEGREYGTLDQLASIYGGMSQLSATPQVANQQAVLAQQTYANYQTAQLYQAALERARANPDDVQAQKEALRLSTLISQGSNDVQNGGLTPEAKAAQLSALQQYGALTSPEVTAKERYLYESQRQQQEQQEAASRAALMDEYRVRGMGGSGMELGSILQAGQQNAQQRLLGDLGTQAGAVDRSMQALQGYSGLSTQMMAQGNQVDQFNMSQRLQALGMRGDMANNIAAQSQQLSEYNAGQANNVNMFNAGQANQNAQFNANAYNQNSMFNAGQANNISMYNAGQVNAVGMNNTNQNMIQGRFADQFKADQQTDAWTRATGLADSALKVTGNQRTDVNNLTGAKLSTNQNDYARTQKSIDDAGTYGSRSFNADQVGVGQTDDFWTSVANNPALAAQRAISAGSLYTGVNSGTGGAIVDQGNKIVGKQVGDEQLKAAQYIPFSITDPSSW